jgi:hypothetical protein
MNYQKIKKDFWTAIPFLLWFESLIVIFQTTEAIIINFSELLLLVYFFSYLSAVLLIMVGWLLETKRKKVMILYWSFIVISLVLPVILPTLVGVNRYVVILINVVLASYITLAKK